MMPAQSMNRAIFLAAALSLAGVSTEAADARFEIDLKELPRATAPHPAKSVHPPLPAGKKTATRASIQPGTADSRVRYTVKPGDHIFKILIRDFGLSNQQAKRIIPDIARLNGIVDIRRLRVGQELVIPLPPSPERTGKFEPTGGTEREPSPPPAQAEAPLAEVQAAPLTAAPSPQPVPGAASPTVQPPTPPLPEQSSVPVPHASPALNLPAQTVRVDVSPVPANDMDGGVDTLLDLLAPGWERDRIVEAGRESTDGSYMSIKVARYFEHLGHRYIVNSKNDPLTLTMLRVLEVKGDRVINVGRDEGVPAVVARLVAKMELPVHEGSFRVKCLDFPGGELQVQGVLVSPAGPYEQQLLITGDRVPACAAELLTGGEPSLVVK